MKKLTIFTALAIVAAATASSLTGCEAAKNAAGDLPKQCGLVCAEQGIAEGNASISGVASIDGFFGAVVNYNTTATAVVDALAAPIADIKAQLALSADATPAQVVAKIQADFGITGGVTIDFAPPKCQVSAKAAIDASAKCDASVTPGSATVKCEGRCDADVQVTGGKVGCAAEADMHCTAPSASVACTGSCKGSCELTAAAACSGTCQGTCDGTCDVQGADGKCNGKCSGNCQGTCQLSGGGSCSGTCSGECAVQATGGSCDASAKVECFAEPPSATAKVECNAKCEGSVEPPSAKAECNASVKADAEVKAECTPPSINILIGGSATGTATANLAAYGRFTESFKADMAAMVTAMQRAEFVLRAGVGVVAAIPSVTSSFKAAVSGDVDLKTSIGLGCAIVELPKVAGSMKASTDALTAQVQASAAFLAAFQ
jgi:hypothetical protein